MRRTVDAVGEEVTVTGAVTGPLTNAAFLLGAEQLVRAMIRQPQVVHRLCQLSLESSLRYIAAIFTGCVPSLTDAMSSSTVISPKAFAEFSFPYLKQLLRRHPRAWCAGDAAYLRQYVADLGTDGRHRGGLPEPG